MTAQERLLFQARGSHVCKGPEARQTCLVQRLNGVNGGGVAKQGEAAETRYVGRAAGGGELFFTI